MHIKCKWENEIKLSMETMKDVEWLLILGSVGYIIRKMDRRKERRKGRKPKTIM